MKNLGTILTFIWLALAPAIFTTTDTAQQVTQVQETRYCDGWGDGYCEGWKDVKGPFAICPVTPICPVPRIECNRGYRCGYNRGFKRGRRDANK